MVLGDGPSEGIAPVKDAFVLVTAAARGAGAGAALTPALFAVLESVSETFCSAAPIAPS